MSRANKTIAIWLLVGAIGFFLLPWYALQDSILSTTWLRHIVSKDNAPALVQGLRFGRPWLLVAGIILLAGFALLAPAVGRRVQSDGLMIVGAGGLLFLFAQGLAIGPQGWTSLTLAHVFGVLAGGQYGIGWGATLLGGAFAMLLGLGLAARGYFKGDAFVACSVVGIALAILLFTFYPVVKILLSAFQDDQGALSETAFVTRMFTAKIWGVACLTGDGRCGVAWNTLLLALLCAAGCTGLGLAFALIVARTGFRYKRLFRALSILPIITPPFVIGLGLILMFGRSGIVNQLFEWAFGVVPSRWIYGLPGLLLAQIFSFTPIAFMVLAGVVDGISPSVEEAAQTLRADRWRTFVDISLPLMGPGLANAFLISFIESLADFGNPIVLGGNFGVLSTEVFFSVIGAQLDQGRAATLGILLLLFALAAFLLQRRLLGGKSYAVLTGKGDSGLPAQLPTGVRRVCFALALPWTMLTLAIYGMALVGGFVEQWGRNYTPTLKHYAKAFSLEFTHNGILWSGAAWSSFWTTIELSAIAAPATAALGILIAYILTRHRFAGRAMFEFGTMLSFAIPGTVIGVSYILAFNVPPIEITGTALVLIVCNVFRNMPVGIRAGIASMAQIDSSLDEASTTLGARAATTLRRVILPLLRPAIVAALVYSFVRSVTTVSAIIFLVSADYEWATTYIINRVTNGDYGVAIAYCSVLIVLMLAVIALIQLLAGERKLGRRPVAGADLASLSASAA